MLRSIPRLPSSLVQRRGLASTAAPPLMWRLAHGIFDQETGMTEKFPGIPDPKPIDPSAASAPQTTTLDNGIRVVSQDLGGPVSSVALFVGAGSRNETPISTGVSFLLERLAFKGSVQRSKFRMIRDMERTGGIFNASASRETVAYCGEGRRENVADMVSIISETATSPAASSTDPSSVEWDLAMGEINAQVEVMKADLENFESDGAGMVTEAIHSAAFHGNTLGMPLVPQQRNLSGLSPAVVSEFVASNYSADRLVLSASNADHEALVETAQASLGGMPKANSGSIEQARYTGGNREIGASGAAHVAIGLKGVSWQDDDLVPACVLYTLLGGGGSFSSGGPGKGMYTRLYTEVLNRRAWVSSAMAFNHCYADAGVFGIHASCHDAAHLPNLVEIVSNQIAKLNGPLAAGELSRAKAMTKSSLIMNLESRAVVCEDLGRQILTSGRYTGPKELIKKIEAVTDDDLRRVGAKMLSSTPSVVTYGEEYASQEFSVIESAIKAQAQIA